MSNWWDGKALSQSEHNAINAEHYPGTLQLCSECDEPTGRCEEDSIYLDDGGGPICESCYQESDEYNREEGQ